MKIKWIEPEYPIEKFVPRLIDGEFDVRAGWAASWSDHVMSWVSMRGRSEGFLFLRYEDMIQDAERELAKVAGFLKFQPSPERIARAVQLSSADQMRKLEKKEARQWQLTKNTRQDKPFVRAAKSGTGNRRCLPRP